MTSRPSASSMPADIELDLRGLKCPLPVLHTRRAMRGAEPGARLVVLTTDPLAGLDLAHLAREQGVLYEGGETMPDHVRHSLRLGPARG